MDVKDCDCSSFKNVWPFILVLVAVLLVFGVVSAYGKEYQPSIHFVDFAEAEVCGHNAVIAAGENEIAVVLLDGKLSSFVGNVGNVNPDMAYYAFAKVTAANDSYVVFDGVRLVRGNEAGTFWNNVRLGDEVIVQIVGDKIVPVYAAAQDDCPYLSLDKGLRAYEIYNQYIDALSKQNLLQR